MSRRVSLPAADDLFRPSVPSQPRGAARASARTAGAKTGAPETGGGTTEAQEAAAGRRTSGRVRHDEKMTVYTTAEELIELEHARLTLRRDQGLAVDRGRLVREAIAIVLADLEARGEDSELVQRLLSQ